MKIYSSPKTIIIELGMLIFGLYLLSNSDMDLANIFGIITFGASSYCLGVSATLFYLHELERNKLLEIPR